MDDPKLFQAAIPEPYTILGVPLLPYSLGHKLILHRIESPFATYRCAPDITDLAAAVWFCSRPFRQSVASMFDPKLPKLAADLLGKSTGNGSFLRRWRILREVRIDWNSKIELFREYLAHHDYDPLMQWEEHGGKAVTIPEVQIVKLTLMSRLNMSEAELLDRPWSICVADFIGLRAMDQQIELLDEEEFNSARELANRLQMKQNAKGN